jgi:putative chitinase
MMTEQELKACLPFALTANIKKFLTPLNLAMDKYEINTPKRRAAFLAQLAHESGSLKYVREIASGEAYEGRKDLGNVQPGDGVRFKGRGLIQITGRTNYEALGVALNFDFIKEPEKLELPGAAALSAGWFWYKTKLNELADKDDFKKITKKINGGYNGLKDRADHWYRCQKALGIQQVNFIQV